MITFRDPSEMFSPSSMQSNPLQKPSKHKKKHSNLIDSESEEEEKKSKTSQEVVQNGGKYYFFVNLASLVFFFSFYAGLVFKNHMPCTVDKINFTLRFKICFLVAWLLIIAEIAHLIFIRPLLHFQML